VSDELLVELDALLKAWGRAIVSNEAEQIGQFASDDWVIVASAGVFERAQFLSAVESGALTHDTFEVDISRVRSYADTAIVTAHVTNTGNLGGQDFSSDEWTTDVFVKQAGGWKCVLTQLTPRVEAP